MFSTVLVQLTKSQSVLFTTQNKCYISIIVSLTVTALALTMKLLICISFCSV